MTNNKFQINHNIPNSNIKTVQVLSHDCNIVSSSCKELLGYTVKDAYARGIPSGQHDNTRVT